MEAEHTDASDLNVAEMLCFEVALPQDADACTKNTGAIRKDLQCTPRSGSCTYHHGNKHRQRGSRENQISFSKPHKQHMTHIDVLTVTRNA
jgi:hypothetical protein